MSPSFSSCPLCPANSFCLNYISSLSPAECSACPFPLTTKGDFWSSQDACVLNITSVRVIWGLVAGVALILIVLAVPAAIRIFRRRKPKKSPKDLSLFEYRILSELFSSLFILPLGLLECISDVGGQRSIGLDPLCTLLFFVGWAFVMVNFILAKTEKARFHASITVSAQARTALRFYEKSIPLQITFALLNDFIVILMIILPDHMPALRISFFAATTFFGVLSTLLILIVYQSLLSTLQSIKDEDRKNDASKRLVTVRTALFQSRRRHALGVPMGTVCLLFAAVYAIQPYSTYFLSVLLLFGTLGSMHHPQRYLKLAKSEDDLHLFGQARVLQSEMRSDMVSSAG